MVIETKNYASCKDFLKDISFGGTLYNAITADFVFRGHSFETYQLIPTACRKDLKELLQYARIEADNYENNFYFQELAEAQILLQFYNKCDINHLYVPSVNRLRNNVLWGIDINVLKNEIEWLPQDFYEIAALAQHYGEPTRMLDWTYSLETAIYFALSDYLKRNEDFNKKGNIVIWMLNTEITQKRFANKILEGMSANQHLDENNDLSKIYVPLKYIRPMYYGNPNLAAQQGLFTMWETRPHKSKEEYSIEEDRTSLDSKLQSFVSSGVIKAEMFPNPLMYKLIINNNDKYELYNYIKRHHVDASTLFPGYKGVVKARYEDDIVRKNLKDGVKLFGDEKVISISSI